MTALKGRCLCGACRFTATPSPGHSAGVCHCSMCRRWSGGIFLSVPCGDSVEFEDDAPLLVYDSSDWGQRVSCSACGSTLVWRTKDRSMNQVSIQAFDDPGQFEIGMEIFVDDKPASYGLSNETTKMTGAEVMAMFAPQEAEE